MGKDEVGIVEIKEKKKIRCHFCNKKCTFINFKCECGHIFCQLHRYYHSHNCESKIKKDPAFNKKIKSYIVDLNKFRSTGE